MEKAAPRTPTTCHVVAVPYPGRGHINPVMNICKLLATKKPDMLLTFVVPEEWIPALESEPKPDNVALASMPDVLPSQDARRADPQAFYEAVSTQLEAPFEEVLDQLHRRLPVTALLADVSLVWPTGVGSRRGIPVASLFTMSAMMFSLCHNFHLLEANGHYPADFLDGGDEVVEYIPGVSPTCLWDLPTFLSGALPCIVSRLLESFSWLPKAQYQLICTIYELEPRAIDILRSDAFPNLYTVGPAIRYHDLRLPSTPSPVKEGNEAVVDQYLQWLDAKPGDSILYISLGTYAAVSREQTEHLAAGLRESGVRFLWEACGETADLEAMIYPGSGLVVPWCDQLRVLNHPAVGGFLSYCSWNYVEESVFSGVPVLTFPTGGEQPSNSKLIVDDWKIGLRMRKDMHALVDKEEVADVVKRLMDLESAEGKEMRARAREIGELCRSAVLQGGSSESNIKAFLDAISPRILSNNGFLS